MRSTPFELKDDCDKVPAVCRKQTVLAYLALLLGGCSLTHEVARVAVAETPFTLVILEDEKQLLRYRVYAGNTPVSDERLVSRSCGEEELPNPEISKAADRVRVSWRLTCQEVFVEFDTARGQILKDSNSAGSPPRIGTVSERQAER